ncbi:WxL domain-containing protein [Enterococcus faecalis]|uniref:WxL domain-containing protein n=16 Tax=Enterococcus faecalis TaxID=1351 RepID=UPI00032DC884|nr:WxL domain-containing protein [Enterococcus faecalis]EHB6396327.1 WxL domain-containing protein [Enterococcus faecalis]EHD3759343.1 WxL domain-containing protein [Enterococcus faecalis]EHG5976932.1 WxL domain-containing protein [Enterococcus faecalis]EJX8082670.1 WxL domain-containing protein [Enterococcus faecalis]EJX8832122.1 WxL domain-containing protein [Enterococcus faecalis]
MKQTKWQRLATIGLCSSLVINAFSGVTAVAETITIESSPTVASSAKEATSASSATPASTESSQETTETSREEVTQETEKPEVVEKISDDKEKTVISDYLNKGAKTIPEINKISPKATYNFPKVNYQFGFVDEAGNLMNPAPFSILFDYARGDRTTVPVKWTVISANEKATDSADNLKNMVVPAVSLAQPAGGAIYSVPSNFRLTIPKYYSSISIYNSDGKINPKYPVPIVKQYDSGVINNWIDEFHALNLTKDEAGYYKMYDTSVDGHGYPLLMQRYVTPPGKISHNVYTYFSGPVYYHLINRKVTENFVDDNGTKITPPTGFTQGKQTVIDSDPYTFKQSGTLPETYKASNGKTYKFKGWYKGKTKPNTLTATKAPSYAVTYDDNDDLNVVYEEIEAFDFPALTYQFGFVGEDGKLANPADINITYDYKTSAYRGTGGGADDTVSFGTIATNQSATTVGNLKNVTMPATSIARPTETGYNGDAYANFSIKLPRYYQSLNLYDKTGKINPSYPLPAYTRKYSVRYDDQILPEASVIAFLRLTQKPDQSYAPYESYSVVDPSVKYPEFLQRVIYSTDMVSGYANYTTFSSPVYYHLTNRKVTENFVDANGTKITPPTGFTQGKQTVINSDPYTFKQSGTLPDTYTTGGKTYKFKGWYKGKTKPNTLTTTKAPSYAVTYDDNDDLNVVYEEETVTTLYPSMNVNFVDEKGVGFTPTLTFGGKYRVRRTSDLLDIDLYDVTSKSKGNGQYTISANYGMMPLSPELLKIYGNNIAVNGRNQLHFRFNQFSITNQLKYVDSIALDTTKTTYKVTRYDYTPNASTIFDVNQPPIIEDANVGGLDKFTSTNGYFVQDASTLLYMDISSYMNSIRMFGFNTTNTINSMAVYTVTRKQVTENFVNTSGAKITPPTGFTQGNQIPMTSNTFKYTAAKALPATYTAGGKTYTFQGWYKGKTKPNTLTTSTTPTYNTTFDGNDDMTAMYKEEVPKASVALTRTTAETVTSGGNVTWRATITNTSQAPLTTATIKKSTAWTTGLAAPTAMIVTPAGGTAKTVPVTATTWTNGVSLGTDIPVGKSATVQFTTKATGTAGQVLRAGITTSGNYSGVSTSATVRVKDNDQAIVTPTAEGFISVPTFNFGQVGVAGSTQQHGLKKAADYYGNGTRNPYLRIKKTQPNWSLTAQLSQPKSATDSLPTATRLLLGAAPVSSFSNYNQPTELKNAVGTTSAISLNANNTATRIIANQQFTGSNIYQLDFTFNNVKLEVPANQGVKGQQYQAAITWNLVTGP